MRRAVLFLLLLSILFDIAPAKGQQTMESLPPSSPQMRLYKDLAYLPNGHERQKLDLYVPENSGGLMPLIVWIHGGGWMGGSKNHCPPLPWTRKGYVLASIDYRLSQDAKFPAQIEDCKAAVRWLRIHSDKYSIDPDRMVAWGDSAGGHLASLLGTAGDEREWEHGLPDVSSRVQAVIDWYGRADLTRVSTDLSLEDSPSALLLGGCGKKVAALAKKASPILHVSKDDPPFLIMHGSMDSLVPMHQSQALAGALKKAGVESRLVILEGAGHGGEEFLFVEQVKVIDAFLGQYLAPKKSDDTQ
jgi:acetyl esterase/lipase